jgi:multidrug efflux pump subunit AcrA (membrane-fusion protein)
MGKKTNRLIILCALAGLAVSMLTGCNMSETLPFLAGTPTPTPAPTAIDLPDLPTNRVMAEGVIVPVSSAVLGFASPGIVEAVLVHEGEWVESGQVIASLDGKERFEAVVTAAEVAMLNAQQVLDKLDEDAAVERSQASLTLARAETAYDDALQDWEEREYTKGDQDAMDIAYADYISALKTYEALQKDFDGGYADDPIDDEIRAFKLTIVDNARVAKDQALAKLKYLESIPEELDVGALDGSLAVASAELSKARFEWEFLKDGPDPDDWALAEARLRDARIRLESAQKDLMDLELKAPFDGILVTNPLKAGQFSVAEQEAVQLAAILDEGDIVTGWQVETTDLLELSVTDIEIGMPVQIAVDAISGVDFPGKVVRVKSLGEDRRGDITYTVIIDFDENEEIYLENARQLRWNMTAFMVFDGDR